jgi:hypothetical protein
MKKIYACAIQLIGAFSLAACAPPLLISGDTKAGDILKTDAAKQVSMWARFETKCDRIESIKTQVVAVNPVGTGNTVGSRKYGSVDERWTVTLCDKSIPFLVTFTPDGQGGTFYRVSREPQK